MHCNIKCFAIALLLGGLLFNSAGCSKKTGDQDAAPASGTVEGGWHKACLDIKKRLGPGTNTKFQKFNIAGDQKLQRWTFAFSGLQVEIPQADYEVLPRVEKAGKDVSIILKADDLIVTLIQSPPLEPMNDVFLKVGESIPNPERIARTKKLFGKSPTVHDLSLIGFRHTPADLTCNEKERDREEPIAVALILKGTGPSREPLSVYHNAFGLDEVTRHGKLESGSWEFESQISRPDKSLIVGMRASRQEIHKGFLTPTTIKSCGKDCKTVGPKWLQELSGAAKNPTEVEKWKTLKKSLEERKASEKSLQTVTREIQSLSGVKLDEK